ncbi:NAD(P)-binding protein, partial [Acephala macrosclerotiorum]
GSILSDIVSKILQDDLTCTISVLDLPTSLPRLSSVTYHEADITDKIAVQKALQQVQPKVIFYAACTCSLLLPAETHSRVNHEGTLNLLSAIQDLGTVKALIYHSSSSVIEDGYSDLLNASETRPVLFFPDQKFPYPLSKALAEKAVLDANRKYGFLTASIRPAGTFGEGDSETMEKLLGVAKGGRANVQMGDGKNVYDFLYVGNLVHAHILAARKLLLASSILEDEIEDEEKVDGESFHITNDSPWLFWDFTRVVAKEVGLEVKKENIRTVPRWMGMLMAIFAEWWVWIFSSGRRESNFQRNGVRYSTLNRTLDIGKAKRRLGYRPIWSMEEGLRRSVGWYRERGELK